MKQIKFLRMWMPSLNQDQSSIFEEIYQVIYAPTDKLCEKVHIINSPGKYGKTLLLTVLAAKVSTGLAAQNLERGRTANSRFKIPIDILEDSTCSIKAQSSLAKLVKIAKLIIWDEVLPAIIKTLKT